MITETKKITNNDKKKANAIIERINQKDKKGMDYVYTVSLEENFEFIKHFLKDANKSTVLLVCNGNENTETVGIVFFGENGFPLFYGTCNGKTMDFPCEIDDIYLSAEVDKWCIGEICTSKNGQALTSETESLFRAFLLFFDI